MSHVDSTSPVTHVSLCAGYGGIDLGLHRAIPNLRTIAVSEIEAFACANLVAKMEAGLLDPAPIWTDLKTFPWAEFRDRVDILSGGYPCQPFSAAGKRLGAEDPRHLWPFISAGIAAMRPSACFFENVDGHISMGLPDVLQDLAGLGYRATWCVASASECGAPHQRKRIFILAYDQSLGIQGRWPSWIEESRPHAGQALPVRGGDAGGGELANALRNGSGEGWLIQQGTDGSKPVSDGESRRAAWPSRPGEQQFAWEPPRVVVDAKSQRADRRLDVCDEERRSGPALQPEPNDTGREGEAMDDAARLRGAESADGCGQAASWADASSEARLANAESSERRITIAEDNSGRRIAQAGGPNGEGNGQTQPPLGRDADGPADWLDDAELYTTCDNRTDELRLLGNGVVPACAERAFRLLVGELAESESGREPANG
jgi:DNA (cytosine-5)-methyltransferase 1